MAAQSFDPTSPSLIQRARSDDERAWDQLVQLYGPLVAHWCRLNGLNEHDTADVFQETFRAVVAHLGNFTPDASPGSFRRWLRTIVRSKVADHVRRAARNAAARGGTTARVQLANLRDPLDDNEEEDADEHALLVRRALELIEPEFQARNWSAFVQVTLEGRSAAEVATEMGVAAQVVRQANYRIRRRLRLLLEGEFPED